MHNFMHNLNFFTITMKSHPPQKLPTLTNNPKETIHPHTIHHPTNTSIKVVKLAVEKSTELIVRFQINPARSQIDP